MLVTQIFVTDDDERLRQATCDTLMECGYEVTVAADVEELMRAYRARPSGLVLCDLFMPGKDGLEAIRELRAEFPRARIIAMSGGGFQGSLNVLHIARHLGAADVLPKPFNRARLLEVIERVLGQ